MNKFCFGLVKIILYSDYLKKVAGVTVSKQVQPLIT